METGRRRVIDLFTLDEVEVEAARAWMQRHEDIAHVEGEDGTTGVSWTFCFTPTGIGVAVVVRCSCGDEMNVTNYDVW